MSEDAESKSSTGRWIIAVAVALVLYVLSVGPVAALAVKYDVSESALMKLETFYMPLNLDRPLKFGGEHSWWQKSMRQYCQWWRKIFKIDPIMSM